jgi:hypothetical protein
MREGEFHRLIYKDSGLPTSPIPAAGMEAAGVTRRCRLSSLTNSALVYESKCEGMGGGGGVAGSRLMSAAVHLESK